MESGSAEASIDHVRLALDVGAYAVKAVRVSPEGTTSRFVPHRGRPEATAASVARELCARPDRLAITGSAAPSITAKLGVPPVDPVVALLAAERPPDVRHILDIGAGSATLITVDDHGELLSIRTNTMCAAGTGSFLDEQAARMGIDAGLRSSELDIAEPPSIAARCAVFAKSDVIHRQQEGHTIPELWSGLCRGMVMNATSTLFAGKRAAGPVLLVGGVALSREVVRWLRQVLGVPVYVPEHPETFAASGAARRAVAVDAEPSWERLDVQTGRDGVSRRPRLELKHSTMPTFAVGEARDSADTQIRVHGSLDGDGLLGLDVGSTSTKIVVLGVDGTVRADLYRATAGDPLAATFRLFDALRELAPALRICGVGVTGSGRKLVGEVLSADVVLNEITAHVRAATLRRPDARTIIEIGGQDAKFVSLRDGKPVDVNMNYLCAGGTGSFVEEQANRLGFPVEAMGDAVLGLEPPVASSRCTVFMQRHVTDLIQRGFGPDEVMGAVAVAVAENYLARVVERRPIEAPVLFMGATARNAGLVAAFEQLLGLQIEVSPWCHVMGALGVAQEVLQTVVRPGRPTSFVGMEVAERPITLERSVCPLCTNHCTITTARLENGAGPSWGYLCGREPEARKVRNDPRFEPFTARRHLWLHTSLHPHEGGLRVGLPSALLNHTYLPFWRRFFAELDARVVLSRPTNPTTLAVASEHSGADYCLPIKLAHGHAAALRDDDRIDVVFLPHVLQAEAHDDGSTRSVYCPFNIAFPAIARNAGIAGTSEHPLLTPEVDLQWDAARAAQELEALESVFECDRADLARAWEGAQRAQQTFTEDRVALGRSFLAALEAKDETAVVVIGRDYNLHDPGASLNLPRKIASLGLNVVPMDLLPLDEMKPDPRFPNVYWRHGRQILQAAAFVAAHPRLFAVMLTNHSCGPDAFLRTYVEQILADQPLLQLELDEHGGDAGYMTRLEAFRDVLASHPTTPGLRPPAPRSFAPTTLWIPPMHPYSSRLAAAALRGTGIDSHALPDETHESFVRGRGFCRGTECIPAHTTIGSFLEVLDTCPHPERQAMFIPSARGPCRYGQYASLHRIALDAAGYPETTVEAWDEGEGAFPREGRAQRQFYDAVLAGDLLLAARCRLGPYTDRSALTAVLDGGMAELIEALDAGGRVKPVLRRIDRSLAALPREGGQKPLVGVVGELYLRFNRFTTGDLFGVIEDAGAEAWVEPLNPWFQYLKLLESLRASDEGTGLARRMRLAVTRKYLAWRERSLFATFRDLVGDRPEPSLEHVLSRGERAFPRAFEGEPICTVGRGLSFDEQGVDLIVNCSPFGCSSGRLTSDAFQRLQSEIRAPVVTLFFDGETDQAPLLRTHLAVLTDRAP